MIEEEGAARCSSNTGGELATWSQIQVMASRVMDLNFRSRLISDMNTSVSSQCILLSSRRVHHVYVIITIS
jgi:hypothetical protein